MRLVCAQFIIFAFVLFSLANGYVKTRLESVSLSDIEVLTLHKDRMTTGRRSRPVPQLSCIGGTAAKAFKPDVVQCKNVGTDGIDVQWKCEADMSSDYRFGQMDVVCEGYRYPEDPYILKGSCGLEYTLDYTESGLRNKVKSHEKFSYGWRDSYLNQEDNGKSREFIFADLLLVAAVGLIFYGLCRTCLRPRTDQRTDTSSTNDDYPGHPGSGSGFGYGFRSFYNQGDASCGAQARPSGPGFWSGATTGGLIGYLFGSRTGYTGGPSTYLRTTPRAYVSPDPWGGTSSTTDSSGATTSQTRTATGYAGTRRR
ncbi:store-operated calcium entry-associated regulatory factor-like [Artemia franciscana]|uniref:store-operated calcium entry-associated regulatory factor-like n=1 Tax=Artemia franciscana TaxID=6661 RepID=UPI0032DBDD72